MACPECSQLQGQQNEIFKDQVVAKLRRQLQPWEEWGQQQADRRRRIHEMARQLRDWQHTGQVRHKHGHQGPVTRVLKEFWEVAVAGGGASEEECWLYVRSLPIPDKVRQAMPLLFRELSEKLVVTALERLKSGSSPGQDGIHPRGTNGTPKCLRRGFCVPSVLSWGPEVVGIFFLSSVWGTQVNVVGLQAGFFKRLSDASLDACPLRHTT